MSIQSLADAFDFELLGHHDFIEAAPGNKSLVLFDKLNNDRIKNQTITESEAIYKKLSSQSKDRRGKSNNNYKRSFLAASLHYEKRRLLCLQIYAINLRAETIKSSKQTNGKSDLIVEEGPSSFRVELDSKNTM